MDHFWEKRLVNATESYFARQTKLHITNRKRVRTRQVVRGQDLSWLDLSYIEQLLDKLDRRIRKMLPHPVNHQQLLQALQVEKNKIQ